MGDALCSDCSVRDASLCGALTNDELSALNTIGRRQKLSRGETMMWAGEKSLYCGNLLSGVLKLSATTPDGREQIVALLYPPDFIGRPFANAVDFIVSALIDTEVCLFPREAFEKVLGERPQLERLLLQRTFSSLNDARTRILMMGRSGAQERVAAFLLDVASRACSHCATSQDGALSFDLPVTRGEIADVLGLTIETVSRQFAKMKTLGLIELMGAKGVHVRDPDALALCLVS